MILQKNVWRESKREFGTKKKNKQKKQQPLSFVPKMAATRTQDDFF